MRVLLLVRLAGVASSTAAGARPLATPGVTSTEILIGSSVPLSGEAAIAGNVARGIDAYFKYVNAKGGVFGRKLKFTYLDDGYDPGRAVNNTIRLVQQEQVFAMFSSLGTSNNLAVRKLLNDDKVPQLFVSSGATTFGRDYKKYPWTMGYIPPYSEEGEIYGQLRRQEHQEAEDRRALPGRRLRTRPLQRAASAGLGKKASAIVAKVAYDPTSTDVQPQVTQLKASKANVFMVFAFGKFSLQAFNAVSRLGWKPQIFVNDVSSASALMEIVPQKAANGSISIVFGKDPAAPTLEERQRRPPVPVDPEAVRQRHRGPRPQGRLLHGWDGDGVHARGRAEEGRAKPDAGGPHARRDPPDREEQPVRPAGNRDPDDPDLALPADAGPPPALVEQILASVRQIDFGKTALVKIPFTFLSLSADTVE